MSHGPDWWQDEKGKWHPPSETIRSVSGKEVSEFATEPDNSDEITEGNIVSHFKERYEMDSQVLDPEMVRDLRKSKEDTKWAPSTGRSKARFMKPQMPSDLFSGLMSLGAGMIILISVFLDWATAGGSLSVGAVSPMKDSNGAGLLCFGLIVCLLSVLLPQGKRKRWVGLAIMVCGVLSVFLMLFSLIDITKTSANPGHMSWISDLEFTSLGGEDPDNENAASGQADKGLLALSSSGRQRRLIGSLGYILTVLGRATGPRGEKRAAACPGVDSQDLATILDPFRTIFADLGPDRLSAT